MLSNGVVMENGMVFRMEIGRSRWLFCYFIVIHAVMMLTIFSLPIGIDWSATAIGALSLSFVCTSRRHQWLRGTLIKTQILRDESGLWHLDAAKGKKQSALTIDASFVTTHLVIIYLKNDSRWRRLSITIFADAVDKDLFRQLRVYLRDPKVFQ